MNNSNSIRILTKDQIQQKINRMAFQVLEQNFEEKKLLICGIADRGFMVAERIFKKLQEISHFELKLVKVSVDRESNSNLVAINLDSKSLSDYTVVLCDDVLYTGNTLARAIVPIISAGARKIECLVLIHRHHLNFPIEARYVGMSLATTLQEHITVDLTEEEAVYLS